MLSIDELLRIPQKHVHVRVDALQAPLVLGLAPFQADDDLGSDSVIRALAVGCQMPRRFREALKMRVEVQRIADRRDRVPGLQVWPWVDGLNLEQKVSIGLEIVP